MGILKEKWYSSYLKGLPELDDKVIVITGTTSGLGFWIATAAIRLKAKRIFLLNRTSARVEASVTKLEAEKVSSDSGSNISTIDCDLRSFVSVQKAANDINEIIETEALEGIDILINNAGMGKVGGITEDGYLSCSQVNHLSHFLLTAQLFESINAAANSRGEARIVNHSSAARLFYQFDEKSFCKLNDTELKDIKQAKLYSITKIANCLFSLELGRRIQESKIKSVIAEPGLARESTSGLLSFLYPTQSYADGALSVIQAAFGEGVDSGDFYCPGGYLYLRGKPILALKEGKPTWNIYGEKNILDTRAAEKLWELSEAATGISFLSETN